MYQHTCSLTEGPENEITSLSIIHETERPPTRWERIIDRILFWRMPPRRVDRVEMVYQDVEFKRQGLSFDTDGHMTMSLDFAARAPDAPDLKAELL